MFLLYACVGVSLSFGLAALSYEVYEKRFLALKRRFEPTPDPPPSPAVDDRSSTLADGTLDLSQT